MLNLDIEEQMRRCPMYSEPSFKIVEISDEDIILTSLQIGDNGGIFDAGDLGEFEWF